MKTTLHANIINNIDFVPDTSTKESSNFSLSIDESVNKRPKYQPSSLAVFLAKQLTRGKNKIMART